LETLAINLTTDTGGLQALHEVVGQPVRLVVIAASENIQNQVTIFRPGMEGNMGLG
jgi:hypothetical protein